jgi:integrase
MKSITDSIGITYQTGKGYKKCLGWYQHEDGRRLPKIHWLGRDPEQAQQLAFALQKAWLIMQSYGPRGWTPADIANVKEFLAQGPMMLRTALAGVQDQQREIDQRQDQLNQHRHRVLSFSFLDPNHKHNNSAGESAFFAEPKEATLYGAIKTYIEAIKGKRKSDKHKQRCIQVVEVNLKRVRNDCPLAEVDYAWLDKLCDHFKNRPANLKDGKPLSPAGVKNILTYLRLFFQWLDDTGWGKWEAPRKLLKPFKLRIDDLMTPVELRGAGTIKQFGTNTVVALYKAATDRQRTIMLAALFTGATQQELAVLEKSEFDLDAAKLRHFRNKTKVEGIYWLPPELVTFLRDDFVKRPSDPLAFRTADGNPLVSFKNGRQTSDAVRQMWDDLRVAAGLADALSFKYLRKFLADWMMRHGGEAMAQIAMSHSRKTIVSRHYTSSIDFEGFNSWQQQMYAELKAAGIFDKAIAAKPKQRVA